MATCCPPGSLPKLVSDHKQKGTDIDLPGTDLKLYVVGSGDKVILHFYDIWGLNGGRTRFLCDKLSEQGYKVVIPDFYRGKSWDDSPLEPEKVGKFASQFPPEMVVKDAEAVVKYLQEGGAKKFGATASCWGAWALFTCCAHQLPLSACVSYHPALGLAAVFGSTAVELASKVKTAQCLFPAGNDPPDVKPGGEVIKTLEANGVAVECKEYAEVQHGFMPRGDLSDPKVVSACEEAEKLTYEFFSKHL
ncbi:putative carboxymethylenebutenolidase [Symsagittifera roscoffensis]|uniref:putative carboxymethylenebutenolidase n=1 Tax=Symsagittifera roscoffensis TaxID=84072 RepID=UPI00307C7C85